MNVGLKEMMKYIDYIYETVPHLYGGKSVMVHLEGNVWKVTVGDITYKTVKNQKVIDILNNHRCDLSVFESLLVNIICNRGVLLRMKLEKVYDLVGSDLVDAQEKGWEDIANQIKSFVSKPNLKEV